MLKRAFDVLCSSIGLVLFSPVLIGLAAIIKLTSPGPIYYRGQRVGLQGRPFKIFKFRSMVVNADKIGGSSTGDHDPRITAIGRFMRKCKLDELPQLINVFLGQMSLVGPRPEVQRYVDQYTTEEKAILTVRPGITDWASIWNSDEGAVLAGAADPDKAYEELIRPGKLKLQLAYVRQSSLLTDVTIITYTLLKLVKKDFMPAAIRRVAEQEGFPADMMAMARGDSQSEFDTVTELPGHGATREQMAMLHTRYRVAAQLAKGKDVLELACGPGIALGYLGQSARRVEAGDVDPGLVESAREHYGSRVAVHVIDAQKLPFEDGSFDVLLLLEAIYYLPNPQQFVAEARRVLRPDGAVMICSANCERRDFNPSPFTHKYFSAGELRDLLAEHGFAVSLYAGFPVGDAGARGRVIGVLRNVAVKLRLIPKTMAWKIRLKRVLFGKLQPLPKELHVDESQCADLIPLDSARNAADFKVIYAVGRRAA